MSNNWMNLITLGAAPLISWIIAKVTTKKSVPKVVTTVLNAVSSGDTSKVKAEVHDAVHGFVDQKIQEGLDGLVKANAGLNKVVASPPPPIPRPGKK